MIFILSDSHSGVLSLSRFFFDFSTIKENLLTLENVLRNKTVWGLFFKRRFDRNCSQIFVLTEAVSRLEVFCKKVVLENFAEFTGKHLCLSLFFNKAVGPSKLNFAKFLRISFFIEHLRWLLLCWLKKHATNQVKRRISRFLYTVLWIFTYWIRIFLFLSQKMTFYWTWSCQKF